MSGILPTVPGMRPANAFTGIPVATLQQWLTAAQTARHEVSIGGKATVVQYASGEGNRSVTYNRTTVAQLEQYIRSLEVALGMAPPRRAHFPSFG